MKSLFFPLCALFFLGSCNPLTPSTTKISSSLEEKMGLVSILPVQGPLIGGTRLTLNGNNFKTGATVTIDEEVCAVVTFISKTTLECTTPAHSISAVNVMVTNPDGRTSTLPGGFSYISAVTASPGSAITLGGGLASDLDVKMHVSIGETVMGGPITGNAEAKSVSGLEGALFTP